MGFFHQLFGGGALMPTGAPALNPADSVESFSAAIASSGASVDCLTVADAVPRVLAFYRNRRFDRCDLAADGDMLLFQWGVFDWGEGPSFQFDLTRQFIVADALGDAGMSQLSLVLHFAPDEALSALGTGNTWCMSPAEVPEFERIVLASAPYKALANAAPDRVELRWGPV